MYRHIALVALAEPALFDMKAVVAAIRSRHPDVPVEIPASVPSDAWDLPSRRANALWPEARATFARHRHAISRRVLRLPVLLARNSGAVNEEGRCGQGETAVLRAGPRMEGRRLHRGRDGWLERKPNHLDAIRLS